MPTEKPMSQGRAYQRRFAADGVVILSDPNNVVIRPHRILTASPEPDRIVFTRPTANGEYAHVGLDPEEYERRMAKYTERASKNLDLFAKDEVKPENEPENEPNASTEICCIGCGKIANRTVIFRPETGWVSVVPLSDTRDSPGYKADLVCPSCWEQTPEHLRPPKTKPSKKRDIPMMSLLRSLNRYVGRPSGDIVARLEQRGVVIMAVRFGSKEPTADLTMEEKRRVVEGWLSRLERIGKVARVKPPRQPGRPPQHYIRTTRKFQ